MISRIDIEDMTDAQDEALLPCPFCGSAASAEGVVRYSRPVENCTWADGEPVTEAFFCNCPKCGVSNQGALHGYRTKDKAIAAWNRRADLARPSQAGDERVAAAYRDALQLATAIWERGYREVAPDWKPLPDLLGVLSQIDNMVAGLLSRAESQAAEQMRLRSENLLMRASLEPFAKEAGAWEDSCDQEQLVEPFPGYDGLLTVGNCRRARAALAAMDTPKGGGDE